MESGQRVRDGNPFRASLVAATAWLALPEMATISQASDFACEDLKLGNTCVFISAPVIDVQTKLSGWVRVLTMTTWYVFANIPKRLHIPSAWIIDEFPSLRIPSLDVAAPVARKHGIRLLLIAQDLEKMAQAYPKSYKGFGGNSMATIWMGTDHPDNYNDLSEYLGSCMRKEKIEGGWFSKVPARYQLVERKLAQPHQLRELLDPTRGWIVVTRFGKPPLLLALEQPEKALPIWKLNADPAFGEKFLRAFARAVLTWLRPRK
jgi:type IV secretory pathway TraG/TraD family ATPase VirD4